MKKNKTYRLIDSIFFFFLMLSLIVFLFLVGFVISIKYTDFKATVREAYSTHEELQKKLIKQRIDAIFHMVSYQRDYLSPVLEKNEITKLAKSCLLHFLKEDRFGSDKNGYIYIIRKSDGRIVMHPIDSTLVGKDIRIIIDPNGVNIGEAVYRAIDNPEKKFFNYSWYQPSTGDVVPKIGYARYLPDYDWILATGVYVDDIKNEISEYRLELRQNVLQRTLHLLMAAFVILLIIGVFLIFIKRKLNLDLAHISVHFKKAALSGEQIDTKILHFREFCTLAEYVNIVVEKNQKIYDQLRGLAERDYLTGLYNKRKFLENLEREFAGCKRYQHPVSLLMMDLDHFKLINDNFGHDAGDIALRVFSRLCLRSIRDVDIIGRLGGEEFAILMPNTEKEKAVYVAERIRGTIEYNKIKYGSETILMTVSIGVASIPPEELKEPSELLKIADKYLYEAKSSGRNKVSY